MLSYHFEPVSGTTVKSCEPLLPNLLLLCIGLVASSVLEGLERGRPVGGMEDQHVDRLFVGLRKHLRNRKFGVPMSITSIQEPLGISDRSPGMRWSFAKVRCIIG